MVILYITKTHQRIKTMLTYLLMLIFTSFSTCHSANILAAETPGSNTAPVSLVLVGTISSTNSTPLALIQIDNGKLRFYSIGDKVGTYTLTSIQRNSIKLLYNEHSYTLHLQNNYSTVADQDVTNLLSEVELPQQILIKRKLLEHIRTHIQKWLNAVSLTLEITDGRVSGYIIEALSNLPLNMPIGLKQGDVIKSINGIQVSQPELFTQTVNKLINNSDIDIQIERGHKIHNLNFHVSK